MATTATIPLLPRSLVTLDDVALHRGIKVGDTDTTYNKDQTMTQIINSVTASTERLTRRSFKRGTFTEYFDGEQYRFSVPLRGYPIVSITNVWDDPNLLYTSALSTSVYTTGRTGWLKLYKGGRFSSAIQNVKVTYLGGYAQFPVAAGYNDQIRVNDDGSTWTTATIPEPDYGQAYTAEELLTEIKTAVEALSDFDDTLTVTYSSVTRKFTLVSDGSTFEILMDTSDTNWDNRMLYFAKLLGMTTGIDSTFNKTGALTYTSDDPVGGIPDDLKWAVCEWASFLYEQTGGDGGGGNRMGISGSGGERTSTQYYLRRPPDYIMDVIRDYTAGRL